MHWVKARSLMAIGYALLIGCGARTESFNDEFEPGGAAGSGIAGGIVDDHAD